jgi:hypothetical protein
MKATTKRSLVAAAFGLALVAGSLGLGAGEAHARVSRPVMCTPYDLTCKYAVFPDGDQAIRAEPEEPGEVLVATATAPR